MLSKFSYALREMWASLRRNFTLTAAAVITASSCSTTAASGRSCQRSSGTPTTAASRTSG